MRSFDSDSARALRRRALFVSVATLALAATTAPALAHQVGLSRGEYAFAGDTLDIDITFARGEVVSDVPEIDADGDGKLAQAELDANHALLDRAIAQRIAVNAGGPCKGTLTRARLAEEDGATLGIEFRCPAAAPSAHVELSFLEDLPQGHRHIARARGLKGDVEEVLYRGRAAFDVPSAGAVAKPRTAAPTPAAPAATPLSKPPRRPLASFWLGASALGLRFEHVLFLAGLIITIEATRAHIRAALVFAAGLMLGFFSARFGLFSPASRIVGPAVALSMAYVGVEDLAGDVSPNRYLVGLPFGAVHGFALSAAFVALDTEAASSAALFLSGAVAAAFVSVAALGLVSARARRSSLFRLRGTGSVGAAVALAGLLALLFQLGAPGP